MTDKRDEYLSPEELDTLIRQVETREMLQAPSYLKDEILLCVKEKAALPGSWENTAQERNGKRLPILRGIISNDRKKRELLAYSLRVGLAAAAAILMLFWMPFGEYSGNGYGKLAAGTEYQSPSGRTVRALNEHSNELCRKLNSAANWLVAGEKNRNGM